MIVYLLQLLTSWEVVVYGSLAVCIVNILLFACMYTLWYVMDEFIISKIIYTRLQCTFRKKEISNCKLLLYTEG